MPVINGFLIVSVKAKGKCRFRVVTIMFLVIKKITLQSFIFFE